MVGPPSSQTWWTSAPASAPRTSCGSRVRRCQVVGGVVEDAGAGGQVALPHHDPQRLRVAQSGRRGGAR